MAETSPGAETDTSEEFKFCPAPRAATRGPWRPWLVPWESSVPPEWKCRSPRIVSCCVRHKPGVRAGRDACHHEPSRSPLVPGSEPSTRSVARASCVVDQCTSCPRDDAVPVVYANQPAAGARSCSTVTDCVGDGQIPHQLFRQPTPDSPYPTRVDVRVWFSDTAHPVLPSRVHHISFLSRNGGCVSQRASRIPAKSSSECGRERLGRLTWQRCP